MKNFILLLAFVLLCSFAPVEVEPFKLTWPLIIMLLAGFWEVIIRIIPTAGQFGIVGKVIEILAWLSNFFNRSKSAKSKKS